MMRKKMASKLESDIEMQTEAKPKSRIRRLWEMMRGKRTSEPDPCNVCVNGTHIYTASRIHRGQARRKRWWGTSRKVPPQKPTSDALKESLHLNHKKRHKKRSPPEQPSRYKHHTKKELKVLLLQRSSEVEERESRIQALEGRIQDLEQYLNRLLVRVIHEALELLHSHPTNLWTTNLLSHLPTRPVQTNNDPDITCVPDPASPTTILLSNPCTRPGLPDHGPAVSSVYQTRLTQRRSCCLTCVPDPAYLTTILLSHPCTRPGLPDHGPAVSSVYQTRLTQRRSCCLSRVPDPAYLTTILLSHPFTRPGLPDYDSAVSPVYQTRLHLPYLI
ncbi:uncharacterized protein LOC142097589 [Mixophyes fleayi]|uniref:uncharacterized protein LOC142097589 n=1 Tax=Mixophyes fleayi TaxID=3061075 RepID=UPI003F4DE864